MEIILQVSCAGVVVQVFAAARGDLLWSADLELAGQAAQKRIINTESSIAVVAYTPGWAVQMQDLSAACLLCVMKSSEVPACVVLPYLEPCLF